MTQYKERIHCPKCHSSQKVYRCTHILNTHRGYYCGRCYHYWYEKRDIKKLVFEESHGYKKEIAS